MGNDREIVVKSQGCIPCLYQKDNPKHMFFLNITELTASNKQISRYIKIFKLFKAWPLFYNTEQGLDRGFKVQQRIIDI